jgi:hypothetical protein
MLQLQQINQNENVMDYDKYVTSRSYARELKKLHFPQHAFFYWVKKQTDEWGIIDIDELKGEYDYKEFVAAHTSMELREYFPQDIWVMAREKSYQKRKAVMYFAKAEGLFTVTLMVSDRKKNELFELHRAQDRNEANACAEMLKFLTDNQMMSLSV